MATTDDISTFNDLYQRALVATGGYMGGLYMHKFRDGDEISYFLPLHKNKKKSWMGLVVTWMPGKRKPDKAKQTNIDDINLDPTGYNRPGGFAWKKIQPETVDVAVLERFAARRDDVEHASCPNSWHVLKRNEFSSTICPACGAKPTRI